MSCTGENTTCCLILPLLSSQIYTAYSNRPPEFLGTLNDVVTPINDCLTQLYNALKAEQPISCDGLDTALLAAVNVFLDSPGDPSDYTTYENTVIAICTSVLTFVPL
jgi:predicted Zn-dependent protease with MMP-like domain